MYGSLGVSEGPSLLRSPVWQGDLRQIHNLRKIGYSEGKFCIQTLKPRRDRFIAGFQRHMGEELEEQLRVKAIPAYHSHSHSQLRDEMEQLLARTRQLRDEMEQLLARTRQVLSSPESKSSFQASSRSQALGPRGGSVLPFQSSPDAPSSSRGGRSSSLYEPPLTGLSPPTALSESPRGRRSMLSNEEGSDGGITASLNALLLDPLGGLRPSGAASKPSWNPGYNKGMRLELDARSPQAAEPAMASKNKDTNRFRSDMQKYNSQVPDHVERVEEDVDRALTDLSKRLGGWEVLEAEAILKYHQKVDIMFEEVAAKCTLSIPQKVQDAIEAFTKRKELRSSVDSDTIKSSSKDEGERDQRGGSGGGSKDKKGGSGPATGVSSSHTIPYRDEGFGMNGDQGTVRQHTHSQSSNHSHHGDPLGAHLSTGGHFTKGGTAPPGRGPAAGPLFPFHLAHPMYAPTQTSPYQPVHSPPASPTHHHPVQGPPSPTPPFQSPNFGHPQPNSQPTFQPNPPFQPTYAQFAQQPSQQQGVPVQGPPFSPHRYAGPQTPTFFPQGPQLNMMSQPSSGESKGSSGGFSFLPPGSDLQVPSALRSLHQYTGSPPPYHAHGGGGPTPLPPPPQTMPDPYAPPPYSPPASNAGRQLFSSLSFSQPDSYNYHHHHQHQQQPSPHQQPSYAMPQPFPHPHVQLDPHQQQIDGHNRMQ
eukprot:gene4785-34546_t